MSSDINIHISLGGGSSGVSVATASAQTAPQPMALQQLGGSASQTAPGPGPMKSGVDAASTKASCCQDDATEQAPKPTERLARPGAGEAPSPGRPGSSDEG